MIRKLSLSEWARWSEQAHMVVFKEKKEAIMDRYDFVLVGEGEKSKLLGYVTCREFDARSLFWQYGGMFPGTKKTIGAYLIYKEALAWCEERYDRISTVVENTNYAMLKLHMAAGFKIIGFRVWKDTGLCELTREFRET